MDLSPVLATPSHRMVIFIVQVAIRDLSGRSADDPIQADFDCLRPSCDPSLGGSREESRVSAAKMSTFVNLSRGNPNEIRTFKFTDVNFVNQSATRTVHNPAVWLTGKAKKLTESYLVDRFAREKLTAKPCCQLFKRPVAPPSPVNPARADAPARSHPPLPRPSRSCQGSSSHPRSPPSPRSDPRPARHP